MKYTVEEITPQMAENWLTEWNVKNRPVTDANVTELVQIIEKGKWRLTGDPIRFSDTRLIDGQHRLLAIAKAGQTVRSVVIRGLEDECFDVIDQGKRRTASDVLASHEVQYSSCVAAMIPMLNGYYKERSQLAWARGERPPHASLVERANAQHELSAKVGASARINGVVAPSLIACWHYITSDKDNDLADVFWPMLALPTSSSHNVNLLVNRFMLHSVGNKRMSNEQKFSWAACAWNAERQGKKLSINGLKYHKGEPLPRFI